MSDIENLRRNTSYEYTRFSTDCMNGTYINDFLDEINDRLQGMTDDQRETATIYFDNSYDNEQSFIVIHCVRPETDDELIARLAYEERIQIRNKQIKDEQEEIRRRQEIQLEKNERIEYERLKAKFKK
jgi:hypothetical protein